MIIQVLDPGKLKTNRALETGIKKAKVQRRAPRTILAANHQQRTLITGIGNGNDIMLEKFLGVGFGSSALLQTHAKGRTKERRGVG